MYSQKKEYNIKNNLIPLRFIRIAKDLKLKEMASFFNVTTSYISAIEQGQRSIKKETLTYGLNKLKIKYDDYFELESLSYELSQRDNIDELKKFRIMLIKAIGVINSELKEETEKLLDSYYKKEEKKYIKKKMKLANGIIIKKHYMK